MAGRPRQLKGLNLAHPDGLLLCNGDDGRILTQGREMGLSSAGAEAELCLREAIG